MFSNGPLRSVIRCSPRLFFFTCKTLGISTNNREVKGSNFLHQSVMRGLLMLNIGYSLSPVNESDYDTSTTIVLDYVYKRKHQVVIC